MIGVRRAAVPADTDGLVRAGVVGVATSGSENFSTRSAGVNGLRGWRPSKEELLAAFGMEDAPAVVQCAMLGHDWPAWEYVPPPGAGMVGMYRRTCSHCRTLEVRHPCAM